MKQRQKARNQKSKNQKLISRKYKDKYVSIKDIHNVIKKSIRVKSERGTRMLEYSEYLLVLETFLTEVINVVVKEQEVFKLPNRMGDIYMKKLPHKRPFHVRIDYKESKEKGGLVLYKVPILDDYYSKVMWDRPYKYSKYKILPLTRFKELINS